MFEEPFKVKFEMELWELSRKENSNICIEKCEQAGNILAQAYSLEYIKFSYVGLSQEFNFVYVHLHVIA